MRYHSIKPVSIENGPGVRVSIFVCGCTIRCKNCHNSEIWDFEAGERFTHDTVEEILNLCDKSWISGLSILGGEPLDKRNCRDIMLLIRRFRERFNQSKSIWLYTGYTYDDVKDIPILKYIDVLVDGPYIDELRDISLAYRGSSNQRILKLKGGEIYEQ